MLIVALVLLAGCSTTTPVTVIDTQRLEARADAALSAGDLASAALLYRQLADGVAQGRRAEYLMKAADLRIQLGESLVAGELLAEAERSASAMQEQLIQVRFAEIELVERRPTEALTLLDRLGPNVPVEVEVVASAVRGRALFEADRAVEAIRVLAEREVWLNDAQAILDNQRLIWEGIETANLSAARLTGDPLVDGWIDLAPIVGVANPQEQLRALLEWGTRYAQHPASRGILLDLLSARRPPNAFPSRIALLLPLTTPQRNFALAIQDGFLAGHFGSEHGATSIRVYDTGQEGAVAAYFRAQVDGADFVVGPLRRAEVEATAGQIGFVPTLALNYSLAEQSPAGNFYQFALAPEDEARAIARRAIAAGAKTAVALVESDDRGYRILASFRNEFEILGGTILGAEGYDPASRDFSDPITRLMNVDLSLQRQRRLAANLGAGLAFEPRRRQDVDMIFLVADPPAGRLLAPQFEYYYAGDVPTYATSDVYDPGETAAETDLNGLIFPDIPWLVAADGSATPIRDETLRFWPQRGKNLARYYAFGLDAYRIVDALYSTEPFAAVDGVTGRLTMDAEGKIHRDLPFAQFRNGRPEPIATLTRTTRLEASRATAR
jgi:outer membrane PBP1 activator LpoA protein